MSSCPYSKVCTLSTSKQKNGRSKVSGTIIVLIIPNILNTNLRAILKACAKATDCLSVTIRSWQLYSTTYRPSQRATYLTTVLSPQPALLRWSGNTTYTINALQNHRLVDILNFKWTTNEDIKWGSKSQNNSMNHGWNYWFLYKTKQDNIEHTCQAIQ